MQASVGSILGPTPRPRGCLSLSCLTDQSLNPTKHKLLTPPPTPIPKKSGTPPPPRPLSFPTPGKMVPHHPLGDSHQVTVPHHPLGYCTTTVHTHLQAQKLH